MSYAALVKDDRFIERLVQGSPVAVTPAELQQGISASGDRDRLLLTVVVSMPDGQRATGIASAVASNLGSAVNEIEAGKSSKAPQTVLNVVEGPSPSGAPVSPRAGLNLLLGGLLGAGIGTAIAVLRSKDKADPNATAFPRHRSLPTQSEGGSPQPEPGTPEPTTTREQDPAFPPPRG